MAQALKKTIEFTDDFIDKETLIFEDFVKFAETYLTIETLGGDLVPFRLNNPQKRFIKEILQQWGTVGLIDVVIVKARKMGFTTVITAFIYWAIYTNPMNKPIRRAISGTHAKSANPTLQKIMRTYNDNMPEGMSLPVGEDNKSVIEFPSVGGMHITEVASNVDDVARGKTALMLHVAEIAHIDNSLGLAASLMSAVGINVPNSMVFLESTANGTDNYHYEVFIDALDHKDGCKTLAFFAPWWEDERYIEQLYPGFKLSDDEIKEKARYNLTDEQMCWRRSTLSRFKGTPKQRLAQFRQEYPGNWKEAFQFSKTESYIEADLVIDAMNRPQTPQGAHVSVVAAFDPSVKGKDRDAFGIKNGTNIFNIETQHFGDDLDARVNYLKGKLDNRVLSIDMLFVDYGGGGSAIVSRLHNDNYKNVRAIEFGCVSDDKAKAGTKKNEMAVSVNEALSDKVNQLSIYVTEEQRNEVLKDMTAASYKLDEYQRPVLESKDHMKARGVRSTDIFDMICLLYASPVRRALSSNNGGNIEKTKSSWKPFG